MAATQNLGFSSNDLTDVRDLFALVQPGDKISLSMNDDMQHAQVYQVRSVDDDTIYLCQLGRNGTTGLGLELIHVNGEKTDDWGRTRDGGIIVLSNVGQWSVWATEVKF